MNVFYEYDSIFGKAETAHLARTLQESFELAVSIRCKLAKQGYLLDQYLSAALASFSSIGIQESADAGIDSASELRSLCSDVISGNSNRCEHPLYETVKNYIESHPIDFQEDESRLNYYCVRLMGEFTSHAAERFSLNKKEAISKTLDIVNLRDLYRKISAIIGGEDQMERLNLLLRQRFLIVTPMAAFLQGQTTDLLLNLTYRDPESNKQIFQPILNGEMERKPYL